MAERRSPLTPLSFRRDVRLFLLILAGFLALVVIVLLFMMQDFVLTAQEAIETEWRMVATVAAQQLTSSAANELDQNAISILAHSDVAGIRMNADPPHSWGAVGGDNLRELTLPRGNNGSITFFFDESQLSRAKQRLLLTTVVAIGGTAAAIILLLLYIPRITRPIEELVAHAEELGERDVAQEETAYLIQTFRETIDRLHSQEADLKRLHEYEKSRADELELVSATLTRSLTSGFISIDTANRIVQMNTAAREILGIAAEAPVSGAELREVLGDGGVTRKLSAAEADGEVISRQELDHATPHGTITLGLTAVPVVDAGGEKLGTLALFADLTPVRDLEARVRTMQTLADLGEISAGIAHEFRNSLSTILGYLRLARRSTLPEEAEGRLRAATEEANLLSAAVERLLAFARPMRLQLEELDVATIVQPIVDRMREAAPEVAFSVEGKSPVVDADRALVARAVENVIRNAVDAVDGRAEGKRVAIRLTDAPPAVTVMDNGVGLDPADAARLFLPFQSEKPNGFGLGLSLTRKIMLLHGGDVELNGRPGEGAEVRLVFGVSRDE